MHLQFAHQNRDMPMITQEERSPSLAMLLDEMCGSNHGAVLLAVKDASMVKLTGLVPGNLFFDPLSSPNRRKTSEQVTKIEMKMSMMMIHVISA